MNQVLQALGQSTRGFLRGEEGAQLVEYALVIAVVSITLVVSFRALAEDIGGFETIFGRLTACLARSVCD